jgi:phage terminase small subunit
MGRNKTPTAILEAKGAFLINPQRSRPNEPKSDRLLGSPPKYLSKEQKKIWKETAKRLPPGVALESDRDAFEMMVRLTHQMRGGLPMMAAERSTLISLWSRFAMTPADRSRVSVEKPSESKLDQFMNRKKHSQPETPAILN